MQTETKANRRMKGYMEHVVQWKEQIKQSRLKYRSYASHYLLLSLFKKLTLTNSLSSEEK